MSQALRITELRVDGLRNLEGVRVEPSPGANLFLGANGQGKTSLLEAIDYVASLRSFRGATRAQLVARGKPTAKALMRVEGDALPHEFRVAITRTERSFSLDGKRPERAVHYYGAASCVVFHPEDLALVRGAPEQRRRLLDRILLRTLDGYGEALRSYAKTLKSRNAVLRTHAPDARALAAYDPLLARTGSALVRARTALGEELLPAARKAAQDVALTDAEITLAYRTRAPANEADYLGALRESTALDLARRVTSLGPHGDDVSILWARSVARNVASQGQTRALALALRLAELEVLHARTKVLPWLLLDDVSSELDRVRTERLFARVATLGAQVWVTSTDPGLGSLMPGARRFTVADGKVTPEVIPSP